MTGPLEELRLDVAWAQIQGGRETQQDAAAVCRWPNGFHLLILADGMGGHAGGSEASRITVETLRAAFIDQDRERAAGVRLVHALQSANDAVFEFAEKHPELEGMGATAVAVTFDGYAIDWISVGDSPLWLLRDGKLERLNANHSMAQELDDRAARREISPEEARTSPLRSQLLSAVMGEDIDLVDRPHAPLPLQAGDILLLASDGVESLSPDRIIALLEAMPDGDAATCIDRILEEITRLGRPRQDNATLVMASVHEGDPTCSTTTDDATEDRESA